MSRLARRKYNNILKMPDYKIMGTLPNDMSQRLTKMVTTGDTSDSGELISSIIKILNSPIKNVKADNLLTPVESKHQISVNYDTDNPIGIFYLITSGSLTLEIGKDKIEMIPNKIYFVNDRNVYRVVKTSKTPTCVMSGIFNWNKDIHGE